LVGESEPQREGKNNTEGEGIRAKREAVEGFISENGGAPVDGENDCLDQEGRGKKKTFSMLPLVSRGTCREFYSSLRRKIPLGGGQGQFKE